ncbi:MAG: hypothetical protein NC548_10780 [Lachnospiraceae bacterium]|nr:hypothetical protein [Lachnospiraceae bacterium]
MAWLLSTAKTILYAVTCIGFFVYAVEGYRAGTETLGTAMFGCVILLGFIGLGFFRSLYSAILLYQIQVLGSHIDGTVLDKSYTYNKYYYEDCYKVFVRADSEYQTYSFIVTESFYNLVSIGDTIVLDFYKDKAQINFKMTRKLYEKVHNTKK